MKKTLSAIIICCLSSLILQADPPAIAIAGDLLVDINASDLSSVGSGNQVNLWHNNGTTPDFESVNGTGGPTFQIRDGVPLVRFNNTATHTMTNGPMGSVPATILGSDDWTLEAWVYRENNDGGKTLFAWTPRDSLTDNYGTVMELRYFDADNFVEHYGADHNVSWGGTRTSTRPGPDYNQWHHLVVTRDEYGLTRLYCDGRMVSEGLRAHTNLKDDGVLTIGGVFSRGSQSWINTFKGDISQIRVHSAALTPAEVLNNYYIDNTRYNRANVHDALWQDSWYNGVQLSAERGLIIDSSTTPLIINSSLELPYLRPDRGALTISDGALLSLEQMTDLHFGFQAGSNFDFTIIDGTFHTDIFQSSYTGNYMNFGYGNGATAIATIGDGLNRALLDHGGSISIGNRDSSGEMLVKAGSAVHAGSWVRVGDRGGIGVLEIEPQASVTCTTAIMGANAGQGYAYVAGTFQTINNRLYLGESVDGYGELHILAGGLVSTSELRPYNEDGTGLLNFDGGTLRSEPNTSYNFISGTQMAITMTANGANFDVPTEREVVVAVPISDNSESGGGNIVKTGIGTLILNGALNFTGDIIVSEGAVVLGANALATGYNNTILLENNAHIGLDSTGGVNTLLSLLDTSSVGVIRVYGNNASEDIDLSNYPGITLQPRGTHTHTGTITPYNNHYLFAPAGIFTFNQVISDLPGLPATITMAGTSQDAALVLGGNNTITGNITVESGTLDIAHANAAGTSASQNILLKQGTVLKLSTPLPANYLETFVSDNSDPQQIILTGNNAGYNLDLTRFPNCFVGTAQTELIYSGNITPANNDYLLGGGKTPYISTPNTGLQIRNLSDGAGSVARRAVIGRSGMVSLYEGNTYSGGTIVTNNGILFINSDGLGVVPSTLDPTNLILDGGILRLGNANFTLPANRGIYIGSQGATLHPWGSYTSTLLGPLSGSGSILINDGGFITLGSSANTYNGSISRTSGSGSFTIGTGDAFSWASTGGITNAGITTLNNNFDVTFTDTIHGNGGITKLGTGKLTLIGEHFSRGPVKIDSGAIELTGNAAFNSASYIQNNAALVFNNNTPVNAPRNLYGKGNVTLASDATLNLQRFSNFPLSNFTVGDNATLIAQAPSSLGTNTITLNNGNLVLHSPSAAFDLTGFTGYWHLNRNKSDGNGCRLFDVGEDRRLYLTPNLGDIAVSAYYSLKVSHGFGWEVEFDYLVGDRQSNPADGFAFLLHNDSRGPTALGSSGGSIGAAGITPSAGIFVNIYNNDTVGWFINGAKVDAVERVFDTTHGIQDGNVHFKIEYKDHLLTLVMTKDSKTHTMTRPIDLVQALGGDSSYIGFAAGTGGATAEQIIANFRFTNSTSNQPTDFMPLNDAGWKTNGVAIFITEDDSEILSVTPNEGGKSSSTWHRQKVNFTQPFTITMRYWITEKSGDPADGIAFVFQNVNIDQLGTGGGGLGALGISKLLGWGLDIYKSNEAFVWYQDGARLDGYRFETLRPNNVYPENGTPVDVTITYDLDRMHIAMTQDSNTASATSPAFDPIEIFGSLEAWFGITGGTGGETAAQFVSNPTLTYDYLGQGAAGYITPLKVAGNSNLLLNMGYTSHLSIGDITLAPNASLQVAPSPSTLTDFAYAVHAGKITVPAEGASISIANNGTGMGFFFLGSVIDFDTTGTLTLAGYLDADDKVSLKVSEKFNGSRALLDMTNASGLSLADFELDSPMGGARLKLANGILYAVNSDGTVMLLR